MSSAENIWLYPQLVSIQGFDFRDAPGLVTLQEERVVEYCNLLIVVHHSQMVGQVVGPEYLDTSKFFDIVSVEFLL
jgi:hypothetical protein